MDNKKRIKEEKENFLNILYFRNKSGLEGKKS